MKPLTVCSEIQVTYRPAISNKPVVKSALDAYVVLNEFFPDDLIGLKELFVVGYLNRSNRVIGVYEVSSGGITGTVADIRLILGTALKIAATGIIIAHNHPSGNLEPSNTDLMLTKKIREAASYFDIQLLDHLILTWEDKYISFSDKGYL